MIRPPAVAGRFYPAEAARLRETLESFLATSTRKNKIYAKACLVPHAGYAFSGSIAGEVFRHIQIPERAILIGPRHFPRGASLAILSDGAWETPLGLASINHLLAEKLTRACTFLREDPVAHSAEHSLEVQLPFLQQLAPSFSFVPIIIGPVRFEDLETLGRAIAEVIRAEPEPVLLVASSDMNHYETDAITRVKDHKTIERILAIDPRGLYDTVRDENISMCGYGATVAQCSSPCAKLGAIRAEELVRYATSR